MESTPSVHSTNQHGTIGGKRKSKRLEELRIKRQRLENLEDSLAGPKITDINPDCIEHILTYLNLGDLLNVADSNKYLKSVTERIYVRKYGRKNAPDYCGKMILEINEIKLSRKRNYKFDAYSLKPVDLKTCLQLVRCFGHLLHDIILDNVTNAASNAYNRILIYINRYCAEHLRFFRVKGLDILNVSKKPFVRVFVANLIDCGMGKHSLNWLFPNVSSLSYKANGKFINIDKQIPNLKCLYIGISNGKLTNAGKENIKKVFRLNPQLKRLEITLGAGLNMQLLADVSKYLQSIDDLAVMATAKKDFRFSNGTIHFENADSFFVDLKLEREELFPKIPFSFAQLKHLKLRGNCRYSDELFSFISKCPTIKFLQFWDYMYISKMDVTKIAHALPSVRQILFYERYSFEEVSHYLAEFKLLSEFGFRLNDDNYFDDLRARFGNEWQISQGFCIDMKRSLENQATTKSASVLDQKFPPSNPFRT